MYVIKRNGNKELVSFDKILERLANHSNDLKNIDTGMITKKVIEGIYEGITTENIDELTSYISTSLNTIHPEYTILGTRICISNLHKKTHSNYLEVCRELYHNNGLVPQISKELYSIVNKYHNEINNKLNYSRDYLIDYFGFKTLEKVYLLKVNGKIIERPQHLFMRVAIGIHGDNLEKVFETYENLSLKYFIHASPTLFNAGTDHPNLLSCFLLGTQDSINGIYNNLSDCASIMKGAGGIGVHISNIRGKNSIIKSTNGLSNGIVPMLKLYNDTCRFVTQSGKRAGSIAVYIEPHHADILDFLNLRKNNGIEEERTRELFLALWVSDLFMERVKKDRPWTLFKEEYFPEISNKSLSDVWGNEYTQLYKQFEEAGKGSKTIKARELWKAIITSMIETGTPYILYKDTANSKSNQQNLGTIKSSNLCAEIIEYSNEKEYACCTLGSISLPNFVEINETPEFNFNKLGEITRILVRNLNIVIDKNQYTVKQTEISNKRHRPLGIGIQGLADTFIKMNLPFDCQMSKKLNKEIMETIYYHALDESCEIAKRRTEAYHYFINYVSQNKIIIFNDTDREYFINKILKESDKYKDIQFTYEELKNNKIGAYSSYHNSPISNGLFQFNLNTGILPDTDEEKALLKWDFSKLREKIKIYGIRNSLLTALMPTASTSNILGNTEAFEPITSNIYLRRTIAGEFVIINSYLVNDLIKLNLWNKEMKDKIIISGGSITNIPEIPTEIKEKYQTIWEISNKTIIDYASDRQLFVCQSQSMNLYFPTINFNVIHSALFYGWEKKLKTGIYYTRVKPAIEAQQFTIEPKFIQEQKKQENDNNCVMCSS